MASVRLKQGSAHWFACITLPDGRRRQFSTGLAEKDEALSVAIAAEMATKRARSERQLRESLSRLITETMGTAHVSAADWLAAWGKRKEREVGEKTAEAYLLVSKEAAAFFASRPSLGLADVTTEHVTALRDEWAGKHSTGTTNLKLKVVRVAMNEAWRSNLIPDNPAKKVRAVKPTALEKSAPKRRPFTPEEFARVLAACSPEWRALVLLGLFTGQRLNDLAELPRSAFDFDRHLVTFRARKTDALVVLPLLPPVETALKALPIGHLAASPIYLEIGKLSRTRRSNVFRSILAGIGLAPPILKTKNPLAQKGRCVANPLSFHCLRHTATTMLKSAGVADSIARAIIGHESAAVSKVYTHLDSHTIREALERASATWDQETANLA